MKTLTYTLAVLIYVSAGVCALPVACWLAVRRSFLAVKGARDGLN